MICKDNRQVKRAKKKFLKEIKSYEDIDKEIDKYVAEILNTPADGVTLHGFDLERVI